MSSIGIDPAAAGAHMEHPMPDGDSSAIADIAYDDESSELDVTFTSGKKYRYFNVPADVYSDFLDAPSQGKFLNTRIRKVYDFSEIVRRDR